jgi:hypothetical protein
MPLDDSSTHAPLFGSASKSPKETTMHNTPAASVRRFFYVFILGVGAVALLLGLLRQARTTVSAASLAATIRYVAVDGADAGDCGAPASPCRTIQYVVDHASPGDEVRVASGVYTDVHGRPALPGSPCPGVITQVVYLTKSVTIRGGYTTTNWSRANPISHPTTLDAEERGRVMAIGGTVSPTVENLRMLRGNGWALSGDSPACYSGGALHAVSATVTLSANEIADSEGLLGGGLFLSGGWAQLHNNEISDNDGSLGGGLFSSDGFADLQNNAIRGNWSYEAGGGAYFRNSELQVTGNVITGNAAHEFGGGVFLVDSNATLIGNSVVGNSIDDYDGLMGGGVHAEGSQVALSGNEFVGNSSGTWGGGLSVFHTDGWVSGNLFRDNRATQDGGGCSALITHIALTDNVFESNSLNGLWVAAATAAVSGNRFVANDGLGLLLMDGTFTFSHNLVMSNVSPFEIGGIGIGATTNYTVTATLVNNVIVGNRSRDGGNAVAIRSGRVSMLHNTIAGNGGGGASGIWVVKPYDFEPPTYLTLTNNILVSHTVGISVSAGNTVTLQGTLWGAGAWANDRDWGGPGAIYTGTVNVWGDPGFRDPDGGDYHLRPSSAAIDAGVDAGVGVDIDGDARPALGGFDIGADEFVVLGLYRVVLPVLLHDRVD